MAQFYSPRHRSANKIPEKRTLTHILIEELDQFGQGVAHDQGKALFIQNALPGEQVDVCLTEQKRHYAKGHVLKHHTRSEQRVRPLCPHFNQCGGCQLQHVSPELQRESKSQALFSLMHKAIGSLPPAPLVVSGEAYGYRRRARLGIQYIARQKRVVMGFRQKNSNQLIEIEQCPVLKPALNRLIQPLRELLMRLQSRDKLGHAELILADNGPLLTLRHLSILTEQDHACLLAFAQQWQLALFLDQGNGQLTRLQGAEPYYAVAGLKLAFSPQDFIQVNPEINASMVAQALVWLDIQPEDRILDLFCGMGNFTLPLAQRAAEVIGVEGVASLVAKGQNNAVLNQLSNASFYCENLEEGVAQQPWAKEKFDKVLLDPARAGAIGVMAQIIRLAPQRIVYISCDPATLARDSKELFAAGYVLQQLSMLDMFPQTAHLESMALFVPEQRPVRLK